MKTNTTNGSKQGKLELQKRTIAKLDVRHFGKKLQNADTLKTSIREGLTGCTSNHSLDLLGCMAL